MLELAGKMFLSNAEQLTCKRLDWGEKYPIDNFKKESPQKFIESILPKKGAVPYSFAYLEDGILNYMNHEEFLPLAFPNHFSSYGHSDVYISDWGAIYVTYTDMEGWDWTTFVKRFNSLEKYLGAVLGPLYGEVVENGRSV